MPKTVSETPGCAGCPMQRLYPEAAFVPPRWGAGLRLAVGEAPGETESEVGEPFCGGAGNWLRGKPVGGKRVGGLYGAAHVPDNSITFVNVIQCRPPKNVFPTDGAARSYIHATDARQAVAHCVEAHVKPVLKARPWARVDLFGSKALEFVGGRSEGVEKLRGCAMTVGERPAMPTLHPAAIMRDQTMFAVVVNDLQKPCKADPEHYTPFPSLAQAEEWAVGTREFSFDIETNPADNNRIRMVGLARDPYHAIVFPFSGDYIGLLRQLFERASTVTGHNLISFDLPHLEANGVKLNPAAQILDTMLLHHLLFPDYPHDLGFLGSQFCNKAAWKDDKDVEEVYCARDVDVTEQCKRVLLASVRAKGLWDTYSLVSVPLAKICRLMHETGIKLDPGRLEEVRKRLLAENLELEAALPKELRSFEKMVQRRKPAPAGTLSAKTGKPVKFVTVPEAEWVVPWRSNAVKAQYLYETLGLPVQHSHMQADKVTVDKFALDKLIHRHKSKYPWLATLKLLTKNATLLSGFAQEGRAAEGRQHPRFNVHGTNSGRLSSADPNFQNQPPTARYMYVPSHSGWELGSFDYKSIENLLTATLAGDQERLARLAQPGFNEHRWVASLIFGLPEAEIEKDNSIDAPYGRGKRVNHGFNYGLGARKIAEQFDLPEGEVRQWLFTLKTKCHPVTVAWQERTAALAERQGWLANPFGRRRWFWGTRAYTQALSFLPQSTAADVIFRAMIGLMYERIGWAADRAVLVSPVLWPLPQPARLLLQVHDQLVFEYPKELRQRVVEAVTAVMTQPWAELGGLRIPVEFECSDASWGEMKTPKEGSECTSLEP